MNPAFDSYNFCIQGKFGDDSRADCFKQTIQVNHLTLPAGTNSEQAYEKYKACLGENGKPSVGFGPFVLNGNNANTARQNCFTSALQ